MESDDGWTKLRQEVLAVFGENFTINPCNCQTCGNRENIVTHRFADTACNYFRRYGCFSLHPEHVKFTMMFGCMGWFPSTD